MGRGKRGIYFRPGAYDKCFAQRDSPYSINRSKNVYNCDCVEDSLSIGGSFFFDLHGNILPQFDFRGNILPHNFDSKRAAVECIRVFVLTNSKICVQNPIVIRRLRNED